MESRQLEYFLTVLDHGSMNRAAAALHIAQPSLSQAIRALERDLGNDLFHRIGRRLVLTDAGRALIDPARDVVRGLHTARASVDSVGGLQVGRVEIAAMSSQAVDPLSRMVRTFQKQHPRISMSTRAARNPNEVIDMVRTGATELGVLGCLEKPAAAEVELCLLDRQRYVLIAPADGPFRLGGPCGTTSSPGSSSSLARSVLGCDSSWTTSGRRASHSTRRWSLNIASCSCPSCSVGWAWRCSPMPGPRWRGRSGCLSWTSNRPRTCMSRWPGGRAG